MREWVCAARGRAVALVFLIAASPAVAVAGAVPAEATRKPTPKLGLDRLRYDNDLFIGRDDAFFSGGFGQEHHSPLLTDWDRRPNGRPRRPLTRWIGNHLPALRPTDGRMLRFASGFAHTTQTPDDLRTGELQLDDVPYAGTLGVFWSWTAFDARMLDAFQIYAGVLGPLTGAREIHDLLHSGLARGPAPRGWRWQLEDEPLVNVNYALKRKLGEPSGSEVAGIQGDLAWGFQQALGNYHSATELQIEFRAGSDLVPGFARVSDPVGPGIAMEPVIEPTGDALRSRRLHFQTSLVVRATRLWYTPLLDGNTFRDSPHRGVPYDPFFFSAIVGLHFDFGRYSAHVTYFGSGLDTDLSLETRSSPSWLGITLEYHW